MTGVNPATLPHVRVTGCAGGGSSRFSPILVLPITRFTERSAAFTERNPYYHAAQTDMSVYPAIFGPVFLAVHRPTGCRLRTHEYKIRFRESPPICESICKAGPPKDTFGGPALQIQRLSRAPLISEQLPKRRRFRSKAVYRPLRPTAKRWLTEHSPRNGTATG